jgi:hypothetical protein
MTATFSAFILARITSNTFRLEPFIFSKNNSNHSTHQSSYRRGKYIRMLPLAALLLPALKPPPSNLIRFPVLGHYQ